ncbi:uncharacterized protein [Periplaneta americana]|uniref:uncharacterized protein n=1 Tax=Periplaneta americana TaxID=6978 RepID=UPI0037E963CD
MDMVFNYLPDVFSYNSLRHNNYENSWLNESANKDTNRARSGYNKPKKSPREPCKDTKDSCPICQERQRRPLATYIRSKSRQDRKEDNSILEEECEDEEILEEDSKFAADEKNEASATLQKTRNSK